MSQRPQGEAPKRAVPGDTLLVIHDFQARSPDELSLTKGDRIELLEKDDDFGDGWYLGKLLSSGTSGLFPEVYTTVAPRPSHSQPVHTNGNAVSTTSPEVEDSGSTTTTTAAPANEIPTVAEPFSLPQNQSAQSYAQSYQDEISPRTQEFGTERSLTPTSPQPSTTSETESARVAPLNTGSAPQRVASVPNASYSSPMGTNPPAQRSISMVMQNSHNREDSPVIHETLNVIDEHITDMSTPRSSMVQRAAHDSGSEYSSHIDARASYVHGDESDEDERVAFSEEEVSKWTADHVARYLESIGVDRKHCEVFKEQEISGDILLNLDQASIFMKEFDLGVVGRRLRTWHKIRAFQEEVRSNRDLNSRAGDFFDEPFTAGSQGSGAKLPKIPSLVNRSATTATAPPGHRRQESPFARPASHLDRVEGSSGNFLKQTPTESPVSIRAPRLPQDSRQESRRHSSIDYKSDHPSLAPAALDPTPPSTGTPHRKKPSLDRDWSLAGATAAAANPEDNLSPDTSKLGTLTPRSEHQLSTSDEKAEDLDRGYMSGGEIETRKLRNVLRKRDGSSAGHSRQSSYKDESGNLAVSKRHSRFGSAGSIREAIHNMTSGRSRAQSAKEASPTIGTTAKEAGPPLVTKLDYPTKEESSTLTSTATKNSSEATQSAEKTPVGSPSLTSPIGESFSSSPRTSTATSGKAISVDSNDSSMKKSGRSAKTPVRSKHKSKTSAYTRGLRKTPPKDALKDCDYSGWMKKKSPGLLAIWRPRLFVLHGRRLAYYYSEDDTEEKGLIDISSHRVLPAENEFFAGVHATATRAAAIPTSPPNATIQTKNATEAAQQIDKSEPISPKSPKIGLGGDNSMFIFKLVPPRTGLSRAVQFTKPTVHYFATDNVKQGRLWMAALMKATIDRDDSKPVTSTYQQKTISLAKAKAMRQRPPALMGVDEEAVKQEIERVEKEKQKTSEEVGAKGANTGQANGAYVQSAATGLNIEGVDFKPENLVPLTGPGAEKDAGSPDRPSLRLVRSMSNGIKDGESKLERTLSKSSQGSTKPKIEGTETSTSG